MRKLNFIIPALFILFTWITGCDLFNSFEEIKPGRRDYTWEEDTVQIYRDGRVVIARMWGSSPNSIWISNWGDEHKLFHYNGVKCEPYSSPILGRINGIWGSEENDIWFVTNTGKFWHYNGINMVKKYEINVDGYEWITINNIMGIDKKNIFAVGFVENSGNDFKRILLKYNGLTWKFINISPAKEILGNIQFDQSNGDIFVTGYRRLETVKPERKYLLKSSNLIEIIASNSYPGFGSINGKIFHTLEGKIYIYAMGQMNLFKDWSNTNYLARMWGRSTKDFFTINWGVEDGYNTVIGHYNGENLIDIYTPINRRIEDAIVFDNQIIILSEGDIQNEFYLTKGELLEKQ